MLLPIGLLSIVLFVELGLLVRTGPLSLDNSVAIRFKAHRIIGLVEPARIISALTAPFIVFVVGVIILLFLNYLNNSWYPRDLLPLALFGSAALISFISKWYFNRSRPSIDVAAYFDFTTSYPSAHVTFAAAAGSAWLLYATKWKFLIFLITSVVATFIGIIQLFLGIHWFSDFAGSILLSLGLLLIFYGVDDWLAERESSWL